MFWGDWCSGISVFQVIKVSVSDNENGEVDTSVDPVLGESGQSGEIAVTGMLYYHHRTFPYHAGLQDKQGHFLKSGMIVGGIGKNEVKLPATGRYEFENVAFDHSQGFVAEFFLYAADELGLHRGLFYGSHFSASPRNELKTYGTGACEKVKSGFAVKIPDILKYIEEILACEIGSGTCGNVLRHLKPPATVFSSDYSHDI